MIKRALDAGAHGIVIPMCHSEVCLRSPLCLGHTAHHCYPTTQADAAQIVRYSKYPPVGCRGYGPMFAHHSMPGVMAGGEYDDELARDLMVVVQIESLSGLENVEKIAAVEGVDVIFIGEPLHKTYNCHRAWISLVDGTLEG